MPKIYKLTKTIISSLHLNVFWNVKTKYQFLPILYLWYQISTMIALLVILSIIITFKDALLRSVGKNDVGFLGRALIRIEIVISFLVTYFLKSCQK